MISMAFRKMQLWKQVYEKQALLKQMRKEGLQQSDTYDRICTEIGELQVRIYALRGQR